MRLARLVWGGIVVLIGLAIALFISAQAAVGSLANRILSVDEVPAVQVIIVPGASVLPSGQPSDVLRDRLLMANELYAAGKAPKILLSGDHTTDDYDEVNAMRKYLLTLGVAPQDIFLDHAGVDTYDTMYRAAHIFGVKSAIVASQTFHLPRALYIGQALGIDAYGVAVEKQAYAQDEQFALRERFAIVKAYVEVLFGALPEYQGATIDITGDGQVTWDEGL
jgi:vancomycin permeability regulator SanA